MLQVLCCLFIHRTSLSNLVNTQCNLATRKAATYPTLTATNSSQLMAQHVIITKARIVITTQQNVGIGVNAWHMLLRICRQDHARGVSLCTLLLVGGSLLAAEPFAKGLNICCCPPTAGAAFFCGGVEVLYPSIDARTSIDARLSCSGIDSYALPDSAGESP